MNNQEPENSPVNPGPTIDEIIKSMKKLDKESKTEYLQDYIECDFKYADTAKWLKCLEDYGVVVVKNVVNKDEVEKVKSLYWDKVESLSAIKRDDISTWVSQQWPSSNAGFTTSYGISHCEASWYLRTHPNVIGTFASLYETDELITSMDTWLVYRPWWNQDKAKEDVEGWKPHSEGIHSDQSPFYKRGFKCVQGMIPLIDVREHAGGLEVFPQTNTETAQEYLRVNYPYKDTPTDWLVLEHNDKI